MIKIDVDDKQVIAAMERLAKAAANPRPALKAIGEALVTSTKARFQTSTAPDGSRWAPNSQATYLRDLGSAKSLHRKDGRINSKGAGKVMGKRPLIGETGNLSQQIHWRVDADALLVGSTMEYAATQQFGAEQGAFGRDKRNHPIPWGDIPARPFLGVSDQDASKIMSIVNEYLRGAL